MSQNIQLFGPHEGFLTHQWIITGNKLITDKYYDETEINVAHPRDPSKKDFESDLVKAKILYDYMFKVDQNYIRRDRDGSLDGRLDMSNDRISDLVGPTDADDAVTRRCVASRLQALGEEVQDKKSKLDALQNLFGVEYNQVLIRKYEITGLGFEYVGGNLFRKHPHEPDDTNTYGLFDIFTLKEYFIHLLEEPVDDVTWLRNKQPGTYTIHFDLIPNCFSLSYTQETR